MSKPIPEETEQYITMAKSKNAVAGRAMKQLNQMKGERIQSALQDIELANVLKELEAARSGLGGMTQELILARLFQDKSPEQINDMLATMSPEAIRNLTELAKSIEPKGAVSKNETGNDMLLRYLMEKENKRESSTKELLELIKIMKELTPAAPQQVSVQAPPSAQSSINSAVEIVKILNDFNRPFYDTLSKKDKEIMDVKLEALKANMPGSLKDQIEYVKEMAPVLGLGGGGQTSELDLKLESMRQNQDLDNRRLDWEQEKWKMEAENDLHKWEQIGKILQGPVGDVLRNVGNAGAHRISGSGGSGSRIPKPIQTACPNCGQTIYVDAEADSAVCGRCGAVLQRQGAATPPPVAPQAGPAPQPTSTHVDAEQTQVAGSEGEPVTVIRSEQPEQPEGEEENASSENESDESAESAPEQE